MYYTFWRLASVALNTSCWSILFGNECVHSHLKKNEELHSCYIELHPYQIYWISSHKPKSTIISKLINWFPFLDTRRTKLKTLKEKKNKRRNIMYLEGKREVSKSVLEDNPSSSCWTSNCISLLVFQRLPKANTCFILQNFLPILVIILEILDVNKQCLINHSFSLLFPPSITIL